MTKQQQQKYTSQEKLKFMMYFFWNITYFTVFIYLQINKNKTQKRLKYLEMKHDFQ